MNNVAMNLDESGSLMINTLDMGQVEKGMEMMTRSGIKKNNRRRLEPRCFG